LSVPAKDHPGNRTDLATPERIGATLAELDVDGATRAALARYVALLLERNALVNLTAARDPEAIAAHVRDSFALVPYVRLPLVDIGSGGGFPGIPLAIVLGGPVTLVESVGKKAAFLRDVAAALGLGVTVVRERAEEAARNPALRGRFASATARAVASAPTVIELTVPFLEVGGVAVLQRGRLDERERTAATDAALVLGAEVAAEHPAGAGEPGDERRVLLVRKLDPTAQRFPRRAGIPAKRPLCYEGFDG
jgi:16S rRNA (guanine527-N7)-methyltransferase